MQEPIFVILFSVRLSKSLESAKMNGYLLSQKPTNPSRLATLNLTKCHNGQGWDVGGMEGAALEVEEHYRLAH